MRTLVSICLLLFAASAARASGPDGEDRELEEMKKKIEGLDSTVSEYAGIVDALRKIKISGYVQPQFRVANLEGTSASVSGGSFSKNDNKRFDLRRARLKFQYKDMLTTFVVQLEGRQSGVTVKDAYGAIVEPWSKSVGFQMGIFDRPYGFEVAFSSGSRETPERARFIQTIFPGERELGAKLFYDPVSGPLSFIRVDAGVFNGAGPLGSEFDNFKDFIGQVTFQFPMNEGSMELDLGASAYLGNLRNDTKYLWSMGTNSAGQPTFVVDSSLANAGAGVARQYFGADGQFYFQMPVLGASAIRAEVTGGTQAGTSTDASDAFGKNFTTVSPVSQPTGPIYKRNFIGWYVQLVQNLGKHNQLLLKYDVYDPNTSVSGADFVGTNYLTPADIRFDTFGLGFIHHWNKYVKFVFYYEWIRNETLNSGASADPALAPFVNDLNDNIFTFRTQVKF